MNGSRQIESEKIQCLGTFDHKEIRTWLDQREVSFLRALRAYGKTIGEGLELFPNKSTGKTEEIFTGVQLCVESSVILYEKLREKFGSGFVIVNGVVEKILYSPGLLRLIPAEFMSCEINHVWLRFPGKDQKDYFIDGTFGQINPLFRDQIVMGPVSGEARFFRNDSDKVFIETGDILRTYQARSSKYYKDAVNPNYHKKYAALLALEDSLI